MGENAVKVLGGLAAVAFGLIMAPEFMKAGYAATKDAQHLAGQDEHVKFTRKKGLFGRKKEIIDVNTYTGDVKVTLTKNKKKKKGGK